LHFVAFVVFGVQSLDVFAWCLTAVGMGAAAWALVRPADPVSVRESGLVAAGT
jgi:hypothetical protein